jgi:hypothetical protein
VRRRCGRGGLRFVAVPALDLLAAARILGGVGLRLLDHPNDFLTAQAGRRDRDLLQPSRRRILRGNVEDAVGIDVERHLDLRGAARGGRNAFEPEPPERAIVARQAPFSLQHVDVDRIVLLRGITTAITPPSVSTPSDSGVTSRRTTPLTSPSSTAP